MDIMTIAARLQTHPQVSRVPSFVLHEARKSLAASGLSGDTATNVESFLAQVCESESTVPSITPGEAPDSALLHWIAGRISVEVEVGPDGPTYFWGIDADGVARSEERNPDRIIALTRDLVGRIASVVQQANPDWRHQYSRR